MPRIWPLAAVALCCCAKTQRPLVELEEPTVTVATAPESPTAQLEALLVDGEDADGERCEGIAWTMVELYNVHGRPYSEALVGGGRLLRRCGFDKQAKKVLTRASKEGYRFSRAMAMNELALIAREHGDQGLELAHLFEATRIDPAFLDAQENLARALASAYAVSRSELALEHATAQAQRVIERAPEGGVGLLMLARLHWLRGEHRRAELEVLAVMRLVKGGPTAAEAMTLRGHMLNDRDRAAAALRAYRRALELDPTATEAAAAAAPIAVSFRDFEEGSRLCELAASERRYARRPELLRVWATALGGLREWKSARQVYDRLDKLEPDTPINVFNRAALEYRLVQTGAKDQDAKRITELLGRFIEMTEHDAARWKEQRALARERMDFLTRRGP